MKLLYTYICTFVGDVISRWWPSGKKLLGMTPKNMETEKASKCAIANFIYTYMKAHSHLL